MQVQSVQHRDSSISTSDDNYSPTTPLDIEFTDTKDAEFQVVHDAEVTSAGDMNQPPIVLALPAQGLITAEPRGSETPVCASSMDSVIQMTGLDEKTKITKKKKKYEAWDTNGGFSLRCRTKKDLTIAKTITDVSMARALGVEPSKEITSRVKKRPATVSPLDTTGEWSLKRSKSCSPTQVTGYNLEGQSVVGQGAEAQRVDEQVAEQQDMEVEVMRDSCLAWDKVEAEMKGAVDPEQSFNTK